MLIVPISAFWVLWNYTTFVRENQKLTNQQLEHQRNILKYELALKGVDLEKRQATKFGRETHVKVSFDKQVSLESKCYNSLVTYEIELSNNSEKKLKITENVISFFLGYPNLRSTNAIELILNPREFVESSQTNQTQAPIIWKMEKTFANNISTRSNISEVTTRYGTFPFSGNGGTGELEPGESFKLTYRLRLNTSKDLWFGVDAYIGINEARHPSDYWHKIDWRPLVENINEDTSNTLR